MKKRFDESIQATLFEVKNPEPAQRRTPFLFSRPPSRHFVFYSARLGGFVLFDRHALEGFSPSLRQPVSPMEIDSTFYGNPAASTVTSWSEKTPEDFIFAVKVPQVITHEKVLVDCEAEFEEFIEVRNKDWLTPG